MSDTLQISISYENAPAPWQNKSFSIQTSGYVLHITDTDEKQQLGVIQAAARSIQGMGMNQVSLNGDWTTEQQWAFYLGFVTAKNQQVINWAGSNTNELDDRKQVFDFMTDKNFKYKKYDLNFKHLDPHLEHTFFVFYNE